MDTTASFEQFIADWRDTFAKKRMREMEAMLKLHNFDGVFYVSYDDHLAEMKKMQEKVDKAYSQGGSGGPEYSWRL